MAGVAMLTLLILAEYAAAAEFLVPSPRGERNITTGSEKQYRNLYAAGGNVTISGDTRGDLHVLGGNVMILGGVEQDLVAAAQSVTVQGSVGGDARLAGLNVEINAPIGGDLLAAASDLTVSSKSQISGDIWVVGSTVTIEGPILGNLKIIADEVTLNAKIQGKVFVRADRGLSFGPRGEADGVTYRGPEEAAIAREAKITNLHFERFEPRKRERDLLSFYTLIKILAWIIAGLLLVKFFGRTAGMVAQSVWNDPWKNLGIGFLGALAVPAAALMALFTFVGYYVALVTLIWYVLAISLGMILAAISVGSALFRLAKQTDNKPNWQWAVSGVVVFKLLSWVPLAGGLLMFLIFLTTFGALLRTLRFHIEHYHMEPSDAPAPPTVA